MRTTRLRRAIGLVAAALLSGCKPPAFAAHESDLLLHPPPALPAETHAFWNDRQQGTYGEMIVGDTLFRESGRLCRAARVTAITEASGSARDQALLYCQQPDGMYRLDDQFSCRPVASERSVVCRNKQGDDVTLDPLS